MRGPAQRTGTCVVSSLEWSAVEDGLRMVRAKRMFEETRLLWIRANDRNETVLDRLGTKVRAIPRDTFNTLFDQMPVSEEVKDIGVAVQVLWPAGEKATLIRFQSPHELIVDTGTVVSNVETPPAGGCRTSVELRMDHVEDCRDVQGFHQVVTLGDHRSILEGFCRLYGISLVRSPRHSTYQKASA